MTTRRLLVAGAFAAIVAAPASARADLDFTDALYLPIGLNLGGSLNGSLPNGFVLGGEISAAYLHHSIAWWGGYADVLHDFGVKATRISVGPEVGWGPVGLDGGFLLEARDGQAHAGTALRLLLSVSLLSVYGRWGHTFGDGERNFGEAGVLLKVPIPIWEKPKTDRPWRGPPPPPAPPEPPVQPVPRDQPVKMLPRGEPVQPVPNDAPSPPPPAAPPP
jgi:hypothetical protein